MQLGFRLRVNLWAFIAYWTGDDDDAIHVLHLTSDTTWLLRRSIKYPKAMHASESKETGYDGYK